MMIIQIDIDGLRTIATLSVKSAQLMEEANGIMNSVVSKHDWKCPERVKIDESLETMIENVTVINNTFRDFASQITNIANEYTDFMNEQIRMNTSYIDELGSLLSDWTANGVTTNVCTGSSIGSNLSEIASTSMNASNVASLSGASHGISIIDFQNFAES